MIIKEAEKKYGKETAMEIWSRFNLNTLEVRDTPEGLDVPDFEWENIYSKLS